MAIESWRRGAQVLALVATTLAWSAVAATPEVDGEPFDRLVEGGHVAFVRHALAPGTGDPAAFDVLDCATQRNLSDAGRAQARAIGQLFRNAGVRRARVFSSEWCRCLETARLLDLGPVEALPALNSFYQRPDEREDRLAALRAFLAELGDGPPVVLVTHQVTISAMTGRYAASGEVLVAPLDRDALAAGRRLPVKASALVEP